ncbi:MAG: hypothetical protein ABI639_17445 [Thermoanaerobaculia bacterium]
MLTRSRIVLAALLIAAAPAIAAGPDRIRADHRPPAPPDGGPLLVWLTGQTNAADCDDVVSGTKDALCCGQNGAWAACDSGGGGGGSGTVTSVGLSVPAIFSLSGSPITTSGTFTLGLATQNANKVWAGPATGADASPTFRLLVSADIPTNAANTSGTAAHATDAAAAAANGSNCSAGQYARGVDTAWAAENCTPDADTQVALDLGDDGSNESTGLTKFASSNDDYSAFINPSSNKVKVDVGKLPPYRQYDPRRPPSSVGTGGIQDEFINGTTITFNGFQNQESSTLTAERDGITLFHPTDSTGVAIDWFTGPNGSTTDWFFHTHLSTASLGAFNQAGLAILATGTEGTPTLMYLAVIVQTTATSKALATRSMTSYTSAQTAVGTDRPSASSGYLAFGYVSSTKVLSVYTSEDGYLYSPISATTLGAHPTTSFGLIVSSLSSTQPSYGWFDYIRVRTDSNRADAGE